MARININSNNQTFNKESLRGEIRLEVKKEFFFAELKRKFKKLLKRLGCLIFILIILGALVFAGAIFLNKSGFVKIPMVDKILSIVTRNP